MPNQCQSCYQLNKHVKKRSQIKAHQEITFHKSVLFVTIVPRIIYNSESNKYYDDNGNRENRNVDGVVNL